MFNIPKLLDLPKELLRDEILPYVYCQCENCKKKWYRNNPEMGPNWIHIDQKLIPTWYQNDSKMIPKWSQHDPNLLSAPSYSTTSTATTFFYKRHILTYFQCLPTSCAHLLSSTVLYFRRNNCNARGKAITGYKFCE